MAKGNVGLELKGFEAVELLLKFDPDQARRLIREALKKALGPVLAEVLRKVPVDSGQLKDSIIIAVPTTKKKTLVRVEIQAGKIPGHPDEWKAFWGIFVEYGTLNRDGSTRIEEKPFMRPAYESQEATSIAIAEREILNAVLQTIMKRF